MVRRLWWSFVSRTVQTQLVSRPVRCTVSQDRLVYELFDQAIWAFTFRLLILPLPCSSILLKCFLVRLTNVNLYL